MEPFGRVLLEYLIVLLEYLDFLEWVIGQSSS